MPAPEILKKAQALKAVDKLDDARVCLQGALDVDPSDAALRMELVLVLGEMGQKAKAVQQLEMIIQKQPYNAERHRFLTFYKNYTDPQDAHIKQMHELLVSPSMLAGGKSSLHFALGKAYEDLKDFEKSFEHYNAGNEIVNQEAAFSIEAVQIHFEQIRQTFNVEFFEQYAKAASSDETPIFIVGMPRSATSLVEQVLASHSAVYGAGELDKLWQLSAKVLGFSTESFDMALDRLTEAKIRNVADLYLAHVKGFSSDARHITDKMPMNFRYVWLIRLMFPNAKIIHCVRDPKDTCLSIFKQRFVQSIPYAYSIENITGYYREYEKLMQHWHSVLPGQIFDFVYEDFIADQRGVTEKLLSHCGLEWQEECLAFHKTIRTVNTASSTQVKQPLYKGAVGYWKNYEPYLGKLEEALTR